MIHCQPHTTARRRVREKHAARAAFTDGQKGCRDIKSGNGDESGSSGRRGEGADWDLDGCNSDGDPRNGRNERSGGQKIGSQSGGQEPWHTTARLGPEVRQSSKFERALRLTSYDFGPEYFFLLGILFLFTVPTRLACSNAVILGCSNAGMETRWWGGIRKRQGGTGCGRFVSAP